MYYSQQFLRRYLSLDVDAKTMAEELTLKSCEVEELHERVLPAKVVIGKVLSVEKHPDADKLVVCQLDCGKLGTFQICTGAVNMVEGNYVPVAVPGCHLPAINLSIEPRQMRGQDSNGMICSKEELGIADDVGEHSIWTLQSTHMRTDPGHADDLEAGAFNDITDKDLGVSLGDKYPWLEGWIIDVENKTITHRPDMFGHFGLALELRTLFPDAIRYHKIQELTENMNPGHVLQVLEHAKNGEFSSQVLSKNVYTYTTVELSGVSIAPSNFYTKLQLIDCGLQSKNNWVDFSNSFMLTTGHPVHFFDKSKIDGGIIVRQAKEGETFVDLFEDEHTLQESDIVIADNSKILALAGIVGSNNSGISDDTKDIIVEIANFDPVVIRKTATRLGLRTDAEVRYEKNINPLFSLAVVELFMDELTYNTPSLGEFIVAGVNPWFGNSDNELVERIQVNREKIYSSIYGTPEISDTFIAESTKTLTGLGCKVSGNAVVTPLWRSPEDMTQQTDVLEEIARIIGFNAIEEKTLPNNSGFKEFLPKVRILRDSEDYLIQTHALDQVETYPWLGKEWLSMASHHGVNLLSLKNPLNPDESHLRYTMLWSMLEVIQKNAPFFDSAHYFDFGKIWNKNREQKEHDVLCIALYEKKAENLTHPLRKAKEIVQGLLYVRNLKGKLEYVETHHHYGHPKQQGTIMLNKKEIGSLVTLHPSLLEEKKIPGSATVTLMELDYTVIEAMLPTKKRAKKYPYESLTDQIVQRDMNFVIDASSPMGLITTAILRCKEIDHVELFDIYAGDNLEQGKKSCAVRITIKGDGALTTEQINEIMNKATASVEAAGGTLRT